VLEGSVQRDSNSVRIVARLIDAETGFQLWSKTYDREIGDIFAVDAGGTLFQSSTGAGSGFFRSRTGTSANL